MTDVLFFFFLWLIGDGDQWFCNTDPGEAVALVLGLGLIVFVFGALLIVPPLRLVLELRAEDRDAVAASAWAAVMLPWLVTWFVPVPGAWGLIPFGMLVVCLWVVPVMLEARASRLEWEGMQNVRQ